MNKIIIWGIGDRTQKYLKFNYFEKCEIVGFVDSNKCGSIYNGKIIYDPSELYVHMAEVDYLVIATLYFSEIYEICRQMNIPKEKILLTDIIHDTLYNSNENIMKDIAPSLYKEMLISQFRLIRINERDDFDESRLLGKKPYDDIKYMSDYFRYRTFEFVADEIEREQIEGDLAEFGVFRGEFASLISKKIPDRKIYLFDTFEGFDPEEVKREMQLERTDEAFEFYHTMTTDERAINAMPFRDKCIICKGLFPESVTEDARNTKYAFVSIDVDFENSIYEGIKFFYPRLSDGGYIFLHDYNALNLIGVKTAVRKYEKMAGLSLKKVPLADRAGTLVIIK